MSSYINSVSVLLVCFVLFIANSAVSGAYTKVCGGQYQRPPTGICGSQLSAIVYGLCGGRVYSPSSGRQFSKRADVGMPEESGPFMNKIAAMSYFNDRDALSADKRGGRTGSITCECCQHQCTYNEFQSYCEKPQSDPATERLHKRYIAAHHACRRDQNCQLQYGMAQDKSPFIRK